MPLLGSTEMTTVGSAKHRLGKCRPCAFFWKPGSCRNGVDCRHCHLCDPHAKKRSQKEMKKLLKAQIAIAPRMQSLSVATVTEVLHPEAKPSCAQIISGRTFSSTSTAASSRSFSPSCEVSPLRRSK